jgi:arylsulfatase A-like enzyme
MISDEQGVRAMTRPNIILITADQQRGDCYGFMGRKIKTPHLDQLRSEGAWLESCITPCVVCQPARASVLTGQLPLTHGVHDNGIDLDPEVGGKGFAGTLSKAGYDTAFFGKAHFSTYHTFQPTGTPECLTSSANYGADWYGPYMGFQHVEMMLLGHNWWLPMKPPHGQHYERWFYADGNGDEKNRLYRENAGDTRGAAQTWHSKLPVAWHNSTWTADRAMQWIRQRSDKPFMTWISFPDPHHPFDCPEPWSRLHHPDDVDLPSHLERDFDNRPWWHRGAIENEPSGNKTNAEARKAYSRIQPQSEQQLREIIANTYGQLALIDHQVGRLMITLNELGLRENTIVIYTADHGDWLGDHGLILKGPMHYEGLLRVGMIARGPGIRAGKTITAPTSTLDLGPTFSDYGETTPLQTQHGQSLRPLLERDDATRAFALNEWELHPNRAGVALSLRTVRTASAKMTVDMKSGAGEMYDLANDPGEMVNRFDDPAFKALKDELLGYIATRPNDVGPLHEPIGMA